MQTSDIPFFKKHASRLQLYFYSFIFLLVTSYNILPKGYLDTRKQIVHNYTYSVMTVQHSVVKKTQMLPISSYYNKCYRFISMHKENIQYIADSDVVGIYCGENKYWAT